MKQRLLKHLKRYTALYITLAILLAAGGLIAYAAYTKSKTVRRVIATDGSGGTLFSSNCLAASEASANVRTVFGSGSGNAKSASAAVTICNYAQSDPSVFYDRDISYSLSASLVKLSNGSFVSVSGSELNGGTVELVYKSVPHVFNSSSSEFSHVFDPSVLLGTGSSQDVCAVTFTGGMVDTHNIYLKLTAAPTMDYGNIPALEGLLVASTTIETATLSWNGYFSDESEDHKPTDYDGFNYVIEGTGTGTYTLTWNTDCLALSDVSLRRELEKESGDITTTTTVINQGTDQEKTIHKSSLILSLDSSIKSRYTIQFYKTSDNNNDYSEWEVTVNGQPGGVKSYVEFTKNSTS